MGPPPPAPRDPAALAVLRARLTDLAFTAEKIRDALGAAATGLHLQAEIDATATRLLAYLGGRRTVGEALERTARDTPDVSGRAARERFTRAALTLVARMLEAGFLEPVRSTTAAAGT